MDCQYRNGCAFGKKQQVNLGDTAPRTVSLGIDLATQGGEEPWFAIDLPQSSTGSMTLVSSLLVLTCWF